MPPAAASAPAAATAECVERFIATGRPTAGEGCPRPRGGLALCGCGRARVGIGDRTGRAGSSRVQYTSSRLLKRLKSGTLLPPRRRRLRNSAVWLPRLGNILLRRDGRPMSGRHTMPIAVLRRPLPRPSRVSPSSRGGDPVTSTVLVVRALQRTRNAKPKPERPTIAR